MVEMPTYGKWMTDTDAGVMARRGADLERVDACLADYEKMKTPAALEKLDLAFKNYKRKNPTWANSPRNRTRAMTRFNTALFERVDNLLKQVDFIWCPGVDKEMRDCSANMIKNLGLDPTLYEGGSTGLEKFGSKAKCYILAHGHEEMPVFSTKEGKWTADQLASMLLASGLNPEIRHIEMLVCHAGESVNSIANGTELYELWKKYKAANAGSKEKISADYTKVSQSDSRLKPQLFNDPAQQLLPLAAGLANSLKKLGCSNFMLTSYKAPVKQVADAKQFKDRVSAAGVRINLQSKVSSDPRLKELWDKSDYIAVMYALAKDWPDYTAVWR
jgi:hypothetical protein